MVKRLSKSRKKLPLLHRIFPFLTALLLFGIFVSVGYLLNPMKPLGYCANTITCIKNLNVEVENGSVGVFNKTTVVPPAINLTLADAGRTVLGESTGSGEKHIYVDLSSQTLSAYEGNSLYMKTKISSGKWHPTPTGTFKIWVKLRATRMSGGTGDDYYNLPNVPFTMFFYNEDVPKAAGFSLHGAYWHNNFGHPMSHGCVNMRTIDAEKLYNWASPTTNGYTTNASDTNPGTEVTIYGNAPI